MCPGRTAPARPRPRPRPCWADAAGGQRSWPPAGEARRRAALPARALPGLASAAPATSLPGPSSSIPRTVLPHSRPLHHPVPVHGLVISPGTYPSTLKLTSGPAAPPSKSRGSHVHQPGQDRSFREDTRPLPTPTSFSPSLTQPPPASPSLRGPYAGGFWIHNSALVPIFKRQMQFFFCSILIAKMFNFQTFVFPGKCFRNRNIPS